MNLNLKIIILISLVGIFTVSSFIFDQMVIYSEDKIREKNFLYKRSFNNYQSSKNIMINTRDLMARIQVKKDFFDDRQTFLQDTITILLNKDLIRKTFDENVSPDYFKNLNTIFTSRYKKVGYDILNECDLAYEFFKGVQIRSFELNIHNNEKIIKAIKGVNKINLENSLKIHDHFTKKLNDERKKIIEIDKNISNMNEFLIFREKYTKLLDFYFLHYDFLDKINEAHRLTFDFYYKEASRYLGEKSIHERNRNYFILLGVLSQILSLFFLIFLFKTLMKISDKKLNVKS
jgi:hypothetical protein|tara:strand:- start:127 stop:996 length:870 start_codon:yes stop_codon:yes gene_type:complete